MSKKYIVFTDLDGTLLDHRNYSFLQAIPALDLLKEKNIPLIICTSKTKSEIEHYRTTLQNNFPFISENGGAIYIPNEFFSSEYKYDNQSNSYKIIKLGTNHKVLLDAIKELKNNCNLKIETYSDMDINRIIQLTNLSPDLAELSTHREYDEPFIINENQNDYVTLKEEIRKRGLNHTEGSRFHHIMGNNDKGKAVELLINLFRENTDKRVISVALGDSLNDYPMLKKVDIPILVKKSNGEYEARIDLENLVYADEIGPVGWNKIIINLFNN
ncbi:MAG: HAD-IIB family hydrolase [Thermodesulfobacteriota bacterium]